MTEVTISHLIAYDPEKDLLPLILAHCNYSLEVGKETSVQYDWAALERQLVDRFLRGRPFVDFRVGHWQPFGKTEQTSGIIFYIMYRILSYQNRHANMYL